MHENFQKYIGGVACREYGINVCDSLTILCQYCYNETTESYHVNKHKTRFILMQNICLCEEEGQHPLTGQGDHKNCQRQSCRAFNCLSIGINILAVSYTHLTLSTIYSV